MAFLNNMAAQDSRNVLTGKDGALYRGDGTLMATVDTFLSQYNFTNIKYQPLGSFREREIGQSVGATITFTNWVIESEEMFDDMVNYVANNILPDWNFQGVIKNRQGSYERMVYYGCVPSGANDIQNLTVGDAIKRNYSLFVNGEIKKQESMTRGTDRSSTSISSPNYDGEESSY